MLDPAWLRASPAFLRSLRSSVVHPCPAACQSEGALTTGCQGATHGGVQHRSHCCAYHVPPHPQVHFAIISSPHSHCTATAQRHQRMPIMRLQTIKSRPSDQGKKVTASIYFALAAALAFLALAYLVAPARFLASAFGTPGESMVGWQQRTLALRVVAECCDNVAAEKGERVRTAHR